MPKRKRIYRRRMADFFFSFFSFLLFYFLHFLYLSYELGVLQWHSDGVGVRSTNTISQLGLESYNSVFRRHAIVVHMDVSRTRIFVSAMII